MTKSFRNHLKAVFRMPSIKIEKVSFEETEAKIKDGCGRNGALGTASCPDLLQSRADEPTTLENMLQARSSTIVLEKLENVAYQNAKQILSHFVCPSAALPPTDKSPTSLNDMESGLRIEDIFSAFACPQIPPGLPNDDGCKCTQCADGCYQVTFDTPRLCNGPVCCGYHNMDQNNQNYYPTCQHNAGNYQNSGQFDYGSYQGWGQIGACNLCCCCATPNANTNSGQTFYAPCSPEAFHNASHACIGAVLCSNAAPVDCINMPANSDCQTCCGCCHHGWDNYQQPYHTPSQYGECHCQCCCCAAQLASPDYTEPYSNNYETEWGNSYDTIQCQYDPSWCNYGCGYNLWGASCQHYSPYQYAGYAPNAATYENPAAPCLEAPCEAEPAESPNEAASVQDPKQLPEPPKCIKNISYPASEAATACFCPDCAKNAPSSDNANSKSNSDGAIEKPLPPPRWHGINPTLAKTYPFNSTTRKYHQRTSPVTLARAAFALSTQQAVKPVAPDPKTKESDEVDMPQVWSFPESYKRFFKRLSTANTINLRSDDEHKPTKRS